MEIIICKNHEEVSEKAKELIVKQLQRKPMSTLGFPTGSTPILLYKKLVDAYKKHLITFKNVRSFNLDEYVGIEPTHPQSYHQFMDDHLFSHIDIEKKNVYLPKNDPIHAHENARLYNALLKKHQIDLQILGIGTNGHIGFNEPGTPFGQETFVVDLNEGTRQDNLKFFNHIDEVPYQAMTMGIKNIMNSRKIILMASGESKSEAIYQMIKGPVTEQLPASVLQLHPQVIVILDEAAASKL